MSKGKDKALNILMAIGMIAVLLICWLGFGLHFIISLIISIVLIPVLHMIFGKIIDDL